MNTIKEIQRINEEELRLGIPIEQSWHWKYKNCAWIYIGGLSTELTEGDIICVFSQWGEIEDIHLVRDAESGKSKGFSFLKYEDWRSTILAVDNMNGAILLNRTLRVDHKENYEPPKSREERKAEEAAITAGHAPEIRYHEPGHAYKDKDLAGQDRGYGAMKPSLDQGVDIFASLQAAPKSSRDDDELTGKRASYSSHHDESSYARSREEDRNNDRDTKHSSRRSHDRHNSNRHSYERHPPGRRSSDRYASDRRDSEKYSSSRRSPDKRDYDRYTSERVYKRRRDNSEERSSSSRGYDRDSSYYRSRHSDSRSRR